MSLVKMCSSRLPLIVILGATGTGKTKLSLELAERFQTEVISADSMQLYKGLDIVSAKATPEERSRVPHHIIDMLHPHQTFTVVDFRNKALNIIDGLVSKDKIPIIVGGTNYYIESILWKILIEDVNLASPKLLSEMDDEKRKELRKKLKIDKRLTSDDATGKPEVANSSRNVKKVEDTTALPNEAHEDNVSIEESFSDNNSSDEEYYGSDCKLNNEVLYARLKKVDPERAHSLHPNDRRKILRSLQVWTTVGRKHSEVLKEQVSQDGACSLGGPLRFNNAIIFWLFCQEDIHNERLDKRVESMIDDGLIKELTDFHDKYNKQRVIDGESTDYTKGIFQSIGLKEFHSYLILTEEERESEAGQKLFKISLENLKMATKRYARYQKKTIKNRFLGHPERKVPPIYKLDTTDIPQWDYNVYEKAIDIINHFQNGTESSHESESFLINRSYADGNSPKESHFCDVCQRVIVGDMEYKIHTQSRRHRKVLNKSNREKKAYVDKKKDVETKQNNDEGSSL